VKSLSINVVLFIDNSELHFLINVSRG